MGDQLAYPTTLPKQSPENLFPTKSGALIIHCLEVWIVDSLLTDLEELCDYAWLILGVEAIALYFAQEEICRVEHCRVHRASSGIRHSTLKKSG